MISRALHRLPSPITNSLINHLNHFLRLSSSSSSSSSPFSSSKASVCPNNGATYSTNSAIKNDNNHSAVAENARKFARPSTITWSSHLQNCVSLIGSVEYPIKQYETYNGSIGAFVVLRVRTIPDSNSFFSINVEMWDELAERAMLHLKPNDYIYVSGELDSFTKSTLEGIELVRYKVRAKELNYVKLDEPEKSKKVMKSGNVTGESLESTVQSSNSRLHMLQIFFANPDEWYDNRKNKKNPKGPDFKHKDTGEVLWLSARDPPWVKKQLELLDSRLSGGPVNDMAFKFSSSFFVSDEELIVPNPTVNAEDSNYVQLDEPGMNPQRTLNSGKETEESSSNRLHLWQKLFASPDEWDDLRKSKKNQREPDFKHKSTDEELWLNASDPLWVKKKVELLDARHSRTRRPNNDLTSKSSCVADEHLIVPSPSVTAEELNVKHNEAGKNSQRAMNSGYETGKHVGKSSLQKRTNKFQLLQNLLASPNEWYDNRKNKKNPKQPDFKHKSSGEAIWLNETDPPWVKEQIKTLDSRVSGGSNDALMS